MKRKWNEAYVQGMLTCTHTLTLEYMNEAKLSQEGEFWGEHSSWVEMKCLVATSLHSKSFLRKVGGWIPLVSSDVIFTSYP